MREQRFPAGWDKERVRRILAHYETQSEEEAAAEDEQGCGLKSCTAVEVPTPLLPVIRELIAQYEEHTRSAGP